MGHAQLLADLVAYAMVAAPEAAELVKKIVAAFAAQHPALQGAPPADHEASIDAAIDDEIAKLGE